MRQQAWYEQAGVRSGPRRMAGGDGERGLWFFPQRLVPHLGHPLTGDDPGRRRYLAAQHLYQWLQFTVHFEIFVVNRATQLIAAGISGLELPEDTRMTAFQIMTDECYHSLYSLDVTRQLQDWSGIRALPYDFAPYLRELDAVSEAGPGAGQQTLVRLLQVVVFETLITSILRDVPGDASVLTLVRDIVRDHAIDEGRHHAFFAEFFARLWGQLDPATRQQMARHLPGLIVSSLQPATAPARAALHAAGYPPAVAQEIIGDSYSEASVLAGIASAAAKTIGLLGAHGVLDLPGSRDRFAAAGLLPDR